MGAAANLLESLPGGRLDAEASAIRNSEEGQNMRTSYFIGVLCIAAAVFALPASAQNGRQSTPATNGMCDDLAEASPGLQGLCVALCEAQACEAKVNPDTGNVDFGPGCEPSAPRLLDNYLKIVARNGNNTDPAYPGCVQVACPCWTETDLTYIGGAGNDACTPDGLYLQGVVNGQWELASAAYGACYIVESDYGLNAYKTPLSEAEAASCQSTVARACQARGLLD